ncbi:MAG TPA: hypothetical protein VFO76_04390 [Candidatus Kapabacteria bacterium]|nr:hypothetical protein [Candidatus Kapabacteria bacterium]
MTTLRLLLFTVVITTGAISVATGSVMDSTIHNPLSPITDTAAEPNRLSVGCGFSISPFFQNIGNANGIQTNISHGLSTDFLLRYSIKPRYAILSSLSLITHGHYEDKDNPYFLGLSAVFQTRLTGDNTHGLTVAAGPRISYNISIGGSTYPTVFQHLLTEALGRVGYEINSTGSIYAFGIESTYFLAETESNIRLMSASVFFNYFF